MDEALQQILKNVHGDIRHLEKRSPSVSTAKSVHGDIRHLESCPDSQAFTRYVHGDIRHLEIIHTLIRKYLKDLKTEDVMKYRAEILKKDD